MTRRNQPAAPEDGQGDSPEPLVGDPRRSASAPIRGFVYQFWRTVEAWIDLNAEEVLYVEGAEDFDRIRPKAADTPSEAISVQIKNDRRSGVLTLASSKAIAALGNYWKTRTQNPHRRITYQYVTTMSIGPERDGVEAGLHRGESGLELWRACARSTEADHVAEGLNRLRGYLLSRANLDPSLASFIEAAPADQLHHSLVASFEWVTEEPGLEEVREAVLDKLVALGRQRGVTVTDCERAAHALYIAVEEAAIAPAPTALRVRDFLKLFDKFVYVTISRTQFAAQQEALTAVLRRATGFVVTGEPGTREVSVPISFATRFPPPLLPERLLPRGGLREAISGAARRFHVVQIHGGAGTGKTTLVRAAFDGVADSLIWVDLRDRSTGEAAMVLAELVPLLSALPDPPHVVLDDLNAGGGDPRRLERPLGALAKAVHARGGALAVIGYTPVPPRLAAVLGLHEEAAISIPLLDEAEICALLVLRGGLDDVRAASLARIVWLQTSGHPQLVVARIAALERDGFPDPNPLDAIETPPSVEDVREGVRRVISATLSEPARDLLYRLSLIIGPFRRSTALRIAAFEPRVLRPGEIVDELSGPWLERPTKEYLRVSPLVRGAGEAIFTDIDVTRFHAALAASLISERTITMHEFSGAVVHALRGRADWVAAMLLGIFVKAPRSTREALARDSSWVPLVATEPGLRLPFASPVSCQMFRLLQWQVAALVAPRQLRVLAAIMEPEFPADATDLGGQFARHMYVTHRLMQIDAPISPGEFVLKTLEFARLTDDIDVQHLEGEVRVRELFERHEPGGVVRLFAPFLVPRVSRPKDLDDLIATLDSLNPTDRATFLAAFDSADAHLALLFARPWIDIQSSGRDEHEGFAALLQRAVEAGRRWEHIVWARAATRQLSVVLDETLHRDSDAERVLDAAIAEWGESPTLSDQRASIAMNRGDYANALMIWRNLLPVWRSDAQRLDLRPVFSSRNAAVAAARLGLWAEAESLFRSARQRARRFPTRAWSIGLEFDAAYCAWQLSTQVGNPVDASAARERATSSFGAGLRRLERLPNRPENVAEYWVYKSAGHLLWVPETLAADFRKF